MSSQRFLHYLVIFDEVSTKNGFLNNIAPIIKLSVLLFFILSVVSLDKYDLVTSIQLFSFALYITVVSNIPFNIIIRLIFVASIFIFFIAAFNPFLDKNFYEIKDIKINAGIISAIVIYTKLISIFTTTIVFVSTTRFSRSISSLSKLKLPKELLFSLLIMYRFIFIFLSDIISTQESILSRKYRSKTINYKEMKAIVASMIERAVYRAEEVYESILSRGGKTFFISTEERIGSKDILFLSLSILYIILMRFFL